MPTTFVWTLGAPPPPDRRDTADPKTQPLVAKITTETKRKRVLLALAVAKAKVADHEPTKGEVLCHQNALCCGHSGRVI